MNLTDLKEGQLVRSAGDLLQISTVYPPTERGSGYVTARLLVSRDGLAPSRDIVRSVLPDTIAHFQEPTTTQLRLMNVLYTPGGTNR